MRLFFVFGLFGAFSAGAMPAKTQMMKPAAFFQEAEGGLLEPLDLKSKTLTFTAKDMERCGLKLMRESSTMNYSCELPIRVEARTSKLQNQVTPRRLEVDFGGTRRQVFVSVAEDARSVTFSTGFDAAGLDFELSKFNDDFFKVFNKVAHLVIGEAARKQPLRIEVLESRDREPKPPKRLYKAVVKN